MFGHTFDTWGSMLGALAELSEMGHDVLLSFRSSQTWATSKNYTE